MFAANEKKEDNNGHIRLPRSAAGTFTWPQAGKLRWHRTCFHGALIKLVYPIFYFEGSLISFPFIRTTRLCHLWKNLSIRLNDSYVFNRSFHHNYCI